MLLFCSCLDPADLLRFLGGDWDEMYDVLFNVGTGTAGVVVFGMV